MNVANYDAHNSIFIADCNLGRGLFAVRFFATGETILHFTGPLISLAEAIAKGDTEGNPLQVGPVSYIDLETPGVFANHSCEPNAGIRDDVVLVALRPIAAGEEIRYDYSTTMWEESVSGGGLEHAVSLRKCHVSQCSRQLSHASDRPAGALSSAGHRSGIYRPSGNWRRTLSPVNFTCCFR